MARLSVGVDLGGTHVRAGLVDLDGSRILVEERAKLVDRDPAAIADLIARMVATIDPGGTRRGVGIGVAGMLRGWSGVVANAPNLGWREVNFRALLRAQLGERVELYNDLNAIAFGETAFGAARGVRDALCVFVGTGVGAGLVTDGQLYIGATHLAGEIGHVKVVPNGRRCGCGARGCLEAYASGAHLAARAREELGPGGGMQSKAVEIAGSWERVHAGHIDEAARAGDGWALALWAEVAPLLGRTLANAVTLLNPSRLVLGGGVWDGAQLLRERATFAYGEAVNAPTAEAVTLVDSVLGDAAGVLGAAALIAEGVRT
jgi:glucokinase